MVKTVDLPPQFLYSQQQTHEMFIGLKQTQAKCDTHAIFFTLPSYQGGRTIVTHVTVKNKHSFVGACMSSLVLAVASLVYTSPLSKISMDRLLNHWKWSCLFANSCFVWDKVSVSLQTLFSIHYLHIAYVTPGLLSKIFQSIIFNFSWVNCNSQEKKKTMDIGGGVGWGGGRQGV